MAFDRRWQQPSIHHPGVQQPAPQTPGRQLPSLQPLLQPLLPRWSQPDLQSSLQRLNTPGRFQAQPVSEALAMSAIRPNVLQ